MNFFLSLSEVWWLLCVYSDSIYGLEQIWESILISTIQPNCSSTEEICWAGSEENDFSSGLVALETILKQPDGDAGRLQEDQAVSKPDYRSLHFWETGQGSGEANNIIQASLRSSMEGQSGSCLR